jgi:aromatic-L-amino-acid decarboxylase
MTPSEFRHHGKALIDWIADYYENIEQYPVLSPVAPGEVRAALPAAPPETGEAFEAMIADVERIILPGITHWQSPNFYAYFPGNSSFPSILGELLSAGLGVQGMLWVTSPACTELETHVLDWLVDMLALPEQFRSTGPGGGVIQDTASSAVLAALVAAREWATVDDRQQTTDHRPQSEMELSSVVRSPSSFRAYTSTQAHSSVVKAAGIAGIGRENVRQVAVDGDYAMQPAALRRAIEADLAAGLRPFLVVATVGTTSTTAIDPLPAIGAICREFGLWLHVDAALAGTAALCPEFRPLFAGLERADSYAFNPHKWMLTNFDCSCLWVADRAALIGALGILPDYLRNAATASGAVIDYRDWHVQLGRRFRALKLWFVIRHYGVEGLRAHVREHVRLAQLFAGWVAAHPDFELAAPAPLNLVCFRHTGGDAANRALLERLNASGKLYLTHTVLDGRYTLRLAIGGALTQERHVRAAWESIHHGSDTDHTD